MITNQILSKWLKRSRVCCMACGARLTMYKVRNSPDPNGIEYEGFGDKQKVYIKCEKCNQINHIQKLIYRYPL